MSAVAEGELGIPGQPDIAAPEEVRDWIFTFGSGHRLVITPAYGGQPSGSGIPLDKAYVTIRGTFMSARAHMMGIFGTAWASQYESAEEAGAGIFGLSEITLPLWLVQS